jgi:redox-sensitive bicupin YhaK (pirin superfamily)
MRKYRVVMKTKRRQFIDQAALALPVAGCVSPNHSQTMKLTLRKSNERGHANHGWLDSYHTFSFADYYDPAHMGFRSLRVINQDIITPGAGFPTHPHADMEIFSYILWGALAHKDSMGNGRTLLPGQIQLMSAGKGVTHSEFNPSKTEGASLLQIWIRPRQRGLTPSYTEWHPDQAKENEPKVLVISPDGREGSATIHQDADIYRVRLPKGQSITHEVKTGHGAWFQLIKGNVTAHGSTLKPGDAFSTEDTGTLTLTASEDAEALLFDLA